MAVSDKDFAKYRFALIQVATFKQPSYIEDGKHLPLPPFIMMLMITQRTQYTTTSSHRKTFSDSTTSTSPARRGQGLGRRPLSLEVKRDLFWIPLSCST